MRIQFWRPLIILSLAFQMSACSSSGKIDDSSDGTSPPEMGDAGTDAVPPPAPEGDAAAGASTTEDSAGTVAGGPQTDYTVQSGDTLMKIAFETYGDVYKWKAILEANKDKISDPNSLKKGDTLKLDAPAAAVAVDRNGEKYLIKNGDTLGKISGQVYGTPAKWKEIWNNNKQLIHDPNKIFAGFYLYYISDGSGTNLAATPTDPASAVSADGQAAGQAPVQAGDLSAAAAAMAAPPAPGGQ